MSFGFQQSFILVLLTFFEIVQQVYSIKGPTDIKGYIGEDAFFKWNSTNQTKLFSASWGIGKSNMADPQFINVNVYTGKVNINSDLDETIKSRVAFIGNLTKGRAWFVLRNLTVNDTNEYIAVMSDDRINVQEYPVRLVVTLKNETASIYMTRISPNITTAPVSNIRTIRPNITSSPKPPADPPADHPNGLSEAEIAGIVIGAILGVIIIIAGIIYIVYKKNKNKHEKVKQQQQQQMKRETVQFLNNSNETSSNTYDEFVLNDTVETIDEQCN